MAAATHDSARIDLRLVPAALLAWAVAAAGAYLPALWTAGICAILGIAAGVLLATAPQSWRRRRARGGFRRTGVRPSGSALRTLPATLAIACTLGAAVAAHAALLAGPREDGPVANAVAERESVVVHLQVSAVPRELGTDSRSSGRWAVAAEIIDATADGHMIRSRTKILVTGGEGWDRVLPGERVRTAGKLKPAKPGQMEAGVLAAATPPMQPVASPGPGPGDILSSDSPFSPDPSQLKAHFRSATEWLQGDAAGLLPGMVTGDTSTLDEGLENAMKATGTTHLTAVSGANCSLVLGGLVLLARSFRLPRGAAAIVALVALAGFVTMVGPDASVLRAAVMGAVGLVALSSGRRGRSLGFLCLAVTALLVLDPALGTSVGFLLSVLATLGIVLLARRIASWAPSWIPMWLSTALAVPLAAQLFCSPVIVALQPQFTTYSLATNVIVAPFVAPVTILGTIAVPLVPLVPSLAVVPVAIAGASAGMVAGVARYFAGLPGSALPWTEGPFGIATMALWSVVSVLLVWLLCHPVWLEKAMFALHHDAVVLLGAVERGFQHRRCTLRARHPRRNKPPPQ
ncbi:ComEC/Rec2 family competence protein [bacterium RCC_150]